MTEEKEAYSSLRHFGLIEVCKYSEKMVFSERRPRNGQDRAEETSFVLHTPERAPVFLQQCKP